ncbi:MAG: molecular chaperone TorD family protein [Anaerolineae bacterium]
MHNTALRSTLYEALAQAFYPPETDSFPQVVDELLSAVQQGETTFTTLGLQQVIARLQRLQLSAPWPDEGSLLQLKIAYNRLFVGPGRPLAHPYESVYGSPQGLNKQAQFMPDSTHKFLAKPTSKTEVLAPVYSVMGEAAVQSLHLYAQEGLLFCPERKELPDHVAVQLAYMTHLTLQEAEARQKGMLLEAQRYLHKEQTFLLNHLGRWLPSFCDRIITADAHPFYTTLAQLASRYIEFEIEQIESWLSPEKEKAPSGPSTLPLKGWVNLHRQLCTLCGTCADVCSPKALHLHLEDNLVSLTFDPLDCNGCQVCQRFCPEGAITLERCHPSSSPLPNQRQTLMHSPSVICPACSRPHVAEVWLQRILERVQREDGSFAHRLRLCPECKAWSNSTGLKMTISQPINNYGV